jgi:uridine phosphorylase
MRRRRYPILEFDESPEAVIEPSRTIAPMDAPEHCVICFFQEVIAELRDKHGAREIARDRSEYGEHPLYEIAVEGRRLAIFHPGVGASMAAALFEYPIALGCRKFIGCGSAGVLDRDIAVGHIVVAASAVRDEGTSYHYLPPAREVSASSQAAAAIETVLKTHGCAYVVGKTWTTDAFYRETPAKVRLRKREGCLTVEMEAAALFAVAQFRGVTFGQMLYGGDDVSGIDWDHRGWYSRASVREKLFWLAAEACLLL